MSLVFPMPQEDISASRHSEALKRSMYLASPPFPLKRKMLGQFAELSQPPYDDPESDMW
jgi:hypothetical protein